MSSTADNPREDEDAQERDKDNARDRQDDAKRRAQARRHGDRAHLDTGPESGPVFAAAERAVQDLSEALMTALPRDAGQMVRCRRIIGDHYRCNWWESRDSSRHDNAGSDGVMITRFRVVKSRMLRVTVTDQGMEIESGGQQ